ncbi:MAG: hypothetical protein AAGG56_10420 [Pseudomonadota bacterium]
MIDPKLLTVSARRNQLVMGIGVVLICGGGLAFSIGMLAMPQSMSETLARLIGVPGGPIETWQAAALAMIGAVHLSIWILVLSTAQRMFGHLSQGNPEMAARSARVLSNALWVMLAWGLISQALCSAVATWSLPAGERSISLAVGPLQVSLILSALIAGVLTRALALGAELWRDHKGII